VDLFSLFNEIRANPGAYGFTNITGVACGQFPVRRTPSSLFCLQGVTPRCAREYLHVRGRDGPPHGAEHTDHRPQFAESLIEGPYNYSMLAEAPLRARTVHVMGVADGLDAGRQPCGARQVTVFAAAASASTTSTSRPGMPAPSNKTARSRSGSRSAPPSTVTLGAAFGQTRNRGSFGVYMGDFKARDNNYSIFGSVNWGRFYGSAVGTIGNIQYNDIHRNIQLGPLTRTATASTNARTARCS
jgi:outer membrane lipase/esterase